MEYRIKDLPISERPRERLREVGAGALSDAELLALVLRAGTEGVNAVDMARELLTLHGLDGLATASPAELQDIDGMGAVKAGQVQALAELAARMHRQDDGAATIASYSQAVTYLRERLAGREEESLGMVTLDSGNTVIDLHHELFRGSVNALTVEPRVIVKQALKDNAAAVILAHNHPSGRAEPSDEDVQVTTHLKEVLASVDIALLDHIILGSGVQTSLKQEGQL